MLPWSGAQLVTVSSHTPKRYGFYYWSGTYPGCTFSPWSGCIRETTHWFFSLTSMFISLSPFLFLKISKHMPWPMWLGCLEHHPIDRKVLGLIPGQGTYPGCCFHPSSGHIQLILQLIGNQLILLFLTSVFLCLSLPLFLLPFFPLFL